MAQAKTTQQPINKITLTSDNTVNIRGVFTDDSIATWAQKLDELDTKRGDRAYPIYLVLDTPGGSVFAGENFIEIVKQYKNIDTITLESSSMGAFTVELVRGRRYITAHGTMFWHNISVGLQSRFNVPALTKLIKELNQIAAVLIEPARERVHKSPEEFAKILDAETYLTADESIELGFIDEKIEIKCTKDLIKSRESIVVSLGMFGDMEFKFSGCPLFRAPLP